MKGDIRYELLIDESADDDLTHDVASIHVEESVRGPSKFRIAVAIDICKTNYSRVADFRAGAGRLVTVVVSIDGKRQVLVHGLARLENRGLKLGGPGSQFVIDGQDRRLAMDRNYTPNVETRSGSVDVIVTDILGNYTDLKTDVEPRMKLTYSKDQRFAQTSSDLQTIYQLAGQASAEFWLDWKVSGTSVTETAHFRSQPALNDSSPFPIPIVLVPPDEPTLSLNTGDGQNALTEINPVRDAEVPTASGDVWRVDIDKAQLVKLTAAPTQNLLGKKPPESGKFTASFPTAGNADRASNLLTAALNDSAWKSSATLQTTAHALCGLARPRQLLTVKGAGKLDDGQWFVWSVAHDIDPAEHKMRVELRRNAEGG